ncbi:MAG: C39 family peptidase [Desulfobacter sp.]|nr:MAG: C39 family peptidase [Desulfobacter sp.]
MHILVAFIVIGALFSQFYPMSETPKKEITLLSSTDQASAIRTQVTPQKEFANRGITQQSHDFSCGSAALATLLNGQFGESFSEKQVIKGMLTYGDAQLIAKRRAFSLLDMKRFVVKLGYQGNGYKASLQDLEELEQPGIIPIKIFSYRHFVVFKGMAGGHVFLADPWRGNISFPLKEFEEAWYDHIVFLITDGVPASWGALRLTENELRIVDEDDVRKLASDPMYTPRLPDRSIHNGPGAMDVYKRN